MRRALVRLALLMRAVPLLQAVAVMALGFPTFRQPWLGMAAGCVALAWSAWLALRTWATGRCSPPMCSADAAVATVAVLAAGAAVPPGLLTTSFNWTGPYAAATALMLGLGLSPWAGGCGLVGLIAVYGVEVGIRAGVHALPVAAGNAAGSAAYFGCGVVITSYVRRLTHVVDQAESDALHREARLGVQQTRLDEFGRLHDEAVQVLERVMAVDEPDTALRAYAASAADHLRSAIEDPNPGPDSVRDVLDPVAAEFATRGFAVSVQYGTPLPEPGMPALVVLAAVVTESLNNAYKHSGTRNATVRAAGAGHGLEVSVVDEGIGFAPSSVRHGFGITNCICRRVAEAHGNVEFRSAPGAGTVVRIWLPC